MDDSGSRGAASRVIGCECIAIASGSALLRVSLFVAHAESDAVAGATLVVRRDGVERRVAQLPSPAGTAPDAEGRVTLGFALGRADPATARLALLLGGRWLALDGKGARGRTPAVALRAAQARARQLEADVDRANHDREQLEIDLRRTQILAQANELELERSRASAVEAIVERDDALRTAARAEAAAFDATARSEALLARATASANGGPSRRASVLACTLSIAAVTCGALAWLTAAGSPDRREALAAGARGDARKAAPRDVVLARRLQIPAHYLALYRSAARSYGLDWPWLAAVGSVESDHGRSPLPGVLTGVNARGAVGPGQFLLATWTRFGVDGDGDGVLDRRDPDDAVPAMASYLRASGAPQDWARALRSYNHSDAYVGEVRRRAEQIARLGR